MASRSASTSACMSAGSEGGATTDRGSGTEDMDHAQMTTSPLRVSVVIPVYRSAPILPWRGAEGEAGILTEGEGDLFQVKATPRDQLEQGASDERVADERRLDEDVEACVRRCAGGNGLFVVAGCADGVRERLSALRATSIASRLFPIPDVDIDTRSVYGHGPGRNSDQHQAIRRIDASSA